MEDKLSLTYKNKKLELKLGEKLLPLDSIIDPAVIVLSSDNLPALRFEVVIDSMEIDDIEAFGKIIKSTDSLDENKGYMEDDLNDGVNGLR